MANERPVLNIDLDGVVYNFAEAIRLACSSAVGRDLAPTTTWDMHEEWGIPLSLWKRIFRDGVRDGSIWWNGDPIEGAVEGLWELSEQEYYIRVVSNRLNHGFDFATAVEATAHWLDRHKIPYRSLCILGNESKSTYVAETLVDDGVHNIGDWISNSRKVPIIFTQPWNQGLEPLYGHRADNWEDVVRIIKSEVPHG